MRIFVGYQNINSGAKIATEQLIETARTATPSAEFVIYNQNPYRFFGFLSFTRNLLWSVWDFKKKLDNTNIAFSAIYSPYYLVYFAKLLSKQRRTPFYFHLHGDQADIHAKNQIQKTMLHSCYARIINTAIALLQQLAIRGSKKVFFVSAEAKKRFLQDHQLTLPARKAIIVPNGVSVAKFFPVSAVKKRTMKEKLIKNKNDFVLLYAGRIDHKKGVLELLQSMSLLKTKKRICLIILFPKIPDKHSNRYLKLLKKTAIPSFVKIVFRKNPLQPAQYYQIADLVILPSYQEMMPLVMLESFACGTPFMGSAVGNMPKILNHIHKNLVLRKVTPTYIARQISWFLGLSIKEKKRIRLLQKKIIQEFSWENSARIIVKALKAPTE